MSSPLSNDQLTGLSVVGSPSLNRSRLENGGLFLDGESILCDLAAEWETQEDHTRAGVFLRATKLAAGSDVTQSLGGIVGLVRFTSSARHGPFWVKPVTGTAVSQVAGETLWVLAEVTGKRFVLLVPLLNEATKFVLDGTSDALVLRGETGDPAVAAEAGVLLFVATSRDPHELFRSAARALRGRELAGRLRDETPAPDFVDLFGWCTWDAFYHDVTADKVRLGMKAFAAGGIAPRLVILDDGWQTTEPGDAGEIRLSGLKPNHSFNHDLGPLIAELKEIFNVRYFFAWHALLGYWGGIHGDLSVRYEVRDKSKNYGPGVLQTDAGANVRPWGSVVGVASAAGVAQFFEDYHARLKAQGVDGVKVDSQAALEAVSMGLGGRVKLARGYRQAVESSVEKHFGGRMINCMSCTPEGLYLAKRSVVMRTSDDFWPARPESHGVHLFVNAHTALWFGEFILPDWDMFQSQHRYGAYHAAARAISGGPVYVSDRPGEHDFELLKKLMVFDGSILRCDQPARLSPDCLFMNPQADSLSFKVFNTSGSCGLVGLFTLPAKSGEAESVSILGEVSPDDVPDLQAGEFVGYAHASGALWRCDQATKKSITLAAGSWEIVSFAPVRHGFAAIGLADKLNSPAAISDCTWEGDVLCVLQLRDGGTLVGWAKNRPVHVFCDNKDTAFDFDPRSGRVSVDVPGGASRTVRLVWK